MNVHPATEKLGGWLEARTGEMTSFLRELVRAESPTTQPDAQGPVFDRIGGALEDIRFVVRRLPGEATGGQLYARPERHEHGRSLQLLLGHVDTVWPLGTLERMPVEIEDGVLRGPGTFDMKGGLTQLVFALRALHALGLEPPLTPVVFLNSDEEIGSPESSERIRILARRSARSLVLEPALGREGRLKTARRGVARFDVRITGRSAHTGLAPEEGASAIQELSHVIQAVHGLSDPERGIHVNVGRVRGGTRPNIVAPEAVAMVDVRTRSSEDTVRIAERLRELEAAPPSTAGTSVEVERRIVRPPVERTPRNRRLWRGARAVGRTLGLELEEGTSGGASDGNITSQYTATLDGLGAVGDGAHATHEHVLVDRMAERAALLAGILLLPRLVGEHPPAAEGAGTGASADRAVRGSAGSGGGG